MRGHLFARFSFNFILHSIISASFKTHRVPSPLWLFLSRLTSETCPITASSSPSFSTLAAWILLLSNASHLICLFWGPLMTKQSQEEQDAQKLEMALWEFLGSPKIHLITNPSWKESKRHRVVLEMGTVLQDSCFLTSTFSPSISPMKKNERRGDSRHIPARPLLLPVLLVILICSWDCGESTETCTQTTT